MYIYIYYTHIYNANVYISTANLTKYAVSLGFSDIY